MPLATPGELETHRIPHVPRIAHGDFSMQRPKKPSAKPTVAELKELLRAAGLRATNARIAVLAHFFRGAGPQTHGEIADALHGRGYDRTTVYRNLIELADAGLLLRMELGDHVWRFEFRDRRSEAAHPHFLCVECGEVSCLSGLDLTSAFVDEKLKGVHDITEVLLKGHCNDCR